MQVSCAEPVAEADGGRKHGTLPLRVLPTPSPPVRRLRDKRARSCSSHPFGGLYRRPAKDYRNAICQLQLAANGMLFDYLALSQVVPQNPARSVKGPKPVAKKERPRC